MNGGDWTDTAAIVTGHTRGLGAVIATQLLARGVRVPGIARGRSPAPSETGGGGLTQVQLDLADARALTSWLDGGELARFVGGARTALLVNNAGLLQPIGPLEAQSPDAVSHAVAVNTGAALALSAAFASATGDVPDRRILHVSSGAGSNAYAGWSVYCATKAALDHHARAVALDGTPRLRIGSVAPGVIDTDMQAEIRATTEDLFPDRERFVSLKREGQLRSPDEAGRAVVELLLSEAFGRQAVTDLRR